MRPDSKPLKKSFAAQLLGGAVITQPLIHTIALAAEPAPGRDEGPRRSADGERRGEDSPRREAPRRDDSPSADAPSRGDGGRSDAGDNERERRSGDREAKRGR